MEDHILDRVSAEQYLARLRPEPRLVLVLLAGMECPADWTETGQWPPTYAAVGRYVGLKFRGQVLSEAAIRYIEEKAILFLGGTPRRKRKDRRKVVQNPGESKKKRSRRRKNP